MKCLYEVLEIDLNSDESTIRTAYRKLALRCHPDKNQNDPHAEDRFKEIQNAYEILSDPNEKAWYDAHRDAILKSGDRHQAGASAEGMAGVRPDDFVDVYEYYTSSCYSGFGDGQRSFYGVYSTLFSTIAKQEADASAARADKRGGNSNRNLPEFGLSSAEWSEVSAFYAEWASFASARDFSWAGEYNTASAPNRQIRRLMEQDNAKKIKAAKKEYNESIRTLVDFVKKRDRRVIVHQMEEAKRRQERQEADAARREAEKQERLLRAAQYKDAAWAQDSDTSESGDDEDDMLEEQLVWYCPVCEKHFKSEASMANHEKSKKHKELVELLRLELEAEELDVILEEEEGEEGSEGEGIEEEEEAIDNREVVGGESGSDLEESEGEDEEESSQDTDSSTEEDDEEELSSSSEEEEEEDLDDDGEEMDEDAMLASLLNARANLAKKKVEEEEEESSSEEEEEEVTEEQEIDIEEEESEVVEEQNAASKEEEEEVEEDVESRPGSGPPLVLGDDNDSDDDDDDWGTKPKGKNNKKGKKGGGGGGTKSGGNIAEQQPKKAGKKKAEKTASANLNGKQQSSSSELGCSVCGAEFASRNQLFKHISQTGHAQLKTSR